MGAHAIAVLLALAGGSQWADLAAGQSGELVQVDTSTVSRTGDRVTGWLRYTWPTNRPLVAGRYVATAVVHVAVDCAAKTMAADSGVYYDAHDELIGPVEGMAPAQQPPDTLGDAIVSDACRLTAAQ